jgi:hypothetical protein
LAAEFHSVARVLDLNDKDGRSRERSADLADQLAAGRRYEHRILLAISRPNVDKFNSIADPSPPGGPMRSAATGMWPRRVAGAFGLA